MNITYTIPDDQVQRVYDALKVSYGDKLGGESVQQYARRITSQVIRDKVVSIEESLQRIIPPDIN